MASSALMKVYSSNGEDYRIAFKEFLDHTDQKTNAMAWLEREVHALPSKRVFIDAGAGNGKLTAWFVPLFEQVIAIEPNRSLERELRAACPTAVVIPATIGDAEPPARADFVLCSHVFYYLDRGQWLPILERLASWLRSGGVLAVALQNHGTDCMHMLRHFTGRLFDLAALTRSFEDSASGQFEVRIETAPARIETESSASAYVIAEFMMNLLPLSSPPRRDELESYVEQHFRRPEGGYQFSCNQDFLRIRRKA
ncbi:MAG: class I SAM-dependent methyltransferase [Gemmataceae bacterium]